MGLCYSVTDLSSERGSVRDSRDLRGSRVCRDNVSINDNVVRLVQWGRWSRTRFARDLRLEKGQVTVGPGIEKVAPFCGLDSSCSDKSL